MNPKLPVIRLTRSDFSHIPERLWGLPAGMFTGKMWSCPMRAQTDSELVEQLVYIIRGYDAAAGGIRVDCAVWEPVKHARLSQWPPGWAEAALQYRKDWPDSAPKFRCKLKETDR
jgi:hypothetical protein